MSKLTFKETDQQVAVYVNGVPLAVWENTEDMPWRGRDNFINSICDLLSDVPYGVVREIVQRLTHT